MYTGRLRQVLANHPEKGNGQDHMIHFKSWGPNDTSGTAKARIVNFCIQVDYIKSKFWDDASP